MWWRLIMNEVILGKIEPPFQRRRLLIYCICSFWAKWSILGQCVIKPCIWVLARLRGASWSLGPELFFSSNCQLQCLRDGCSFWPAGSFLEALKVDSYWKARRAEHVNIYFSLDRTAVTSSIFKCLSYVYNGIVLWKRPLLLLCGFCLLLFCVFFHLYFLSHPGKFIAHFKFSGIDLYNFIWNPFFSILRDVSVWIVGQWATCRSAPDVGIFIQI